MNRGHVSTDRRSGMASRDLGSTGRTTTSGEVASLIGEARDAASFERMRRLGAEFTR